MRRLVESIHVGARPEQVWSWLEGLAGHYREWHPDHVSARWEEGAPNRVGSVLTVVELLGGHREELRFEITAVEPPRRLRYRLRGLHGVLLPGGAFEVSPEDGGALFTASIDARLGAFAERLFARRVEALRAHMREEGENLKRLLEARAP